MPVPTLISELSTTAGSNSPPGSESPTTTDDYLRAHAAFIAQLRDATPDENNVVFLTGNQSIDGTKTFLDPIVGSLSGNAATATTATNVSGVVAVANGGTGQNDLGTFQSTLRINVARVDVASASTVDLTTLASSTDHINITGTTSISQFTIAAGRMVFIRFAGSLLLNNGGVLAIQSGTSIQTQAGDTCIIRALSANTVEVLSYREGRWANHAGTAPMYACRAWVSFNGTGTVAIRSSGNVSSITDNGTGDYTVNFSTAMPDTNYAVVTGGRVTAPGYSSVQTDAASVLTTGAFRLSTVTQSSGTPTATDCENVSVAVFR